MRRWVWIKLALLLFAGSAVVDGAVAAVICKVGDKKQDVMVLNVGEINASSVALGGEIYKQDYDNYESPGLSCMFDKADETVNLYFFTASGSSSNALQTPSYKHIYNTDLDGVGVSYINRQNRSDVYDFQPLSMSRYFVDAKTEGACKAKAWCKLDYQTTLKVAFVKTGKVSSGQITKIPDLLMYVLTNSTSWIFRVNFDVNVKVVSKTCLAKPVVVNMGAHSTKVFTGIGSTTPSKDFFIELTDCPAFNSSSKKTLQYRIDPILPAINSSNGVLRLDGPSSSAGKHAASGVGVQVVTLKDSPLILGEKLNSGIPLRNTEAGYSIPLRARYIQTESKVVPGPANATANFTIIYE